MPKDIKSWRIKHRLAIAIISACTVFSGSPAFAMQAVKSVTVMADSALSTAIAEIARDYSRDFGAVVNTSFAPASAQESQITEGGAADVLITPRQQWIDELKMRGLIDIYSQMLLAKNQLVLVGPVDSPIRDDEAQSFPTSALIREMNGEQAFVVSHPETQAYGKEALRNLGVADELEPYTLYIKEAEVKLDMVEKHHAYGLFLQSAVTRRGGVRVLSVLPEDSYKPIVYYAVVIAGDNMDEARKFLEYLKARTVRAVLRDNGFLVN